MCSKKALVGAVLCHWVPLGAPGFDPGCRWAPLGTTVHRCVLLGTVGSCWAPLGTFVLILQLVAGNH